MNCECKKDFQQKIEDHVKKGLPEGYENYSANLEGYGLGITDDNCFVTRFMIQYSGKVMIPKKGGGLKSKSIKTFITASYCPFCGKEAN